MWVTAFDEVAEEIVGITVNKFSAFDDDGRKRFVRGDGVDILITRHIPLM